MIRVPGRDSNGVIAALEVVRSQYSDHWDDLFKTVATDKVSEFSLLSGLENLSKPLVYFAPSLYLLRKRIRRASQWPDSQIYPQGGTD